jgi:tape measure domain-containing protein
VATTREVGIRLKVGADGLELVDALAREVEALGGDAQATTAKAAALAAELERLGAERGTIDSFRQQREAVLAAGEALDAAAAKQQQLAREIAATTAPTQAQAAALERANAEVRESGAAYDAARAGLQQLRPALAEAGVAADGLSAAEQRNQQQTTAVRASLAGLTQEIEAQASALRDGISQFELRGQAMEEARLAAQLLDAQLERLRSEIAASTAPTQAQAAAMERVTTEARLARDQFNAERVALVQLREQLAATGVSADALAAAEARVRTQTAAVRNEVAQTTNALRNKAAAYRQVGDSAAASGARQTAVAQAAQQALSGVQGQLQTIQRLAGVAIGGGIFTSLLKDAADTADEMRNLQARIRLVTGEGPAFQAAFEGVTQVALRTNSSLDATATLFTRLAQAGREIGVGQQEALALTESINQAIQLSGASSDASNAAVTQLIQGLQSGVLRGEEFNSVLEQAPRLAQALAQGLGVTTGELRNLAQQGELTSATVIRALRSQRQAIESEFGKLPQTVGRALQNLSTEWSLFVDRLDRGTGATTLVAQGIGKLADNLDTVARVAAVVGTALTVNLALAGVAALRKLSAEMLLASGSANVLSASIAKIPRIVNVLVAFTGFEVGLQIGDKLRENSVLARQFGVAVGDFYQALVNDLILLKDVAAAVFTDDTIDAAISRFQQRVEQRQATTTRLMAEAAKSGLQLRQEAEENAEFSARAAERVGAAGVKAGQDINASAAVGSRALGSLGSAGTAAGAQVAAGGGVAAASLGRLGQAGQTALGALQAIGARDTIAAKLGPNIEQVADALVRVTLRGSDAQRVIGTELPQAIAKLSGPELLQFRTAIVGALEESIRASQRLADQQRTAGASFSESLADAQAATTLLDQVLAQVGQRAAQALGVDAVAAGTRVGEAFRAADDNLQVLLRSLPALQRAGVDTGAVVSQALAKMIDGARNQAEIDAIIDRVRALGDAGEITEQQVGGLFDQATAKVEALDDALDDATPGINSLGEAARRAGVDVEDLTTGISRGFERGVDDVVALSEEMDKAGISAERAGPALEKALDQRIAAADTTEELELLAAVVEEIGDKSQLTERQATRMLDRIKAKAAEVSPEMRQLAEDAALLGIKIDTSARPSLDGLTAAWNRTRAAGQGSLENFVTYARRAIDAAGGLVPPTVAAEAALRGVSIQADTTGKVTVQAFDAGSRAAGRFKEAVEDATIALIENGAVNERNAEVSQEIEDAEAARQQRNNDALSNLSVPSGPSGVNNQRVLGALPGKLFLPPGARYNEPGNPSAGYYFPSSGTGLSAAPRETQPVSLIGSKPKEPDPTKPDTSVKDTTDKAADAVADAFDELGLRTSAVIQAEIAEIERALTALRNDRSITSADLERALAAGQEKIERLRRELEAPAPTPAPPPRTPAPAPLPSTPAAPAPAPPAAPAPPPRTEPVPIAPQIADRVVRVELVLADKSYPMVGTEVVVDSFLTAIANAQRSAGVVGGA